MRFPVSLNPAVLRRALRRRRRLLAGIAILAFVLALASSVLSSVLPSTAVVVVTEDLPAGTQLSRANAEVRTVPLSAVRNSSATLNIENWENEVLATSVPAGAWLRPSDIDSGPDALTPDGFALASVPVSSYLLPHLHQGTQVSITFSTPYAAEPSILEAEVYSVPEADADTFSPASAGNTPYVLVMVPEHALPNMASATFEGWVYLAVID